MSTTGAAVVIDYPGGEVRRDLLRRHQDRAAGRRPEGDRQDRRGRGHRDHPARRRPDGREGHHRRRRPCRRQCALRGRRRQGRRIRADVPGLQGQEEDRRQPRGGRPTAMGRTASSTCRPATMSPIAEMDQATVEQPFSIKAGETKELTVILDAGVLAITAPGATFIEVFAAEEGHPGQPQGASATPTPRRTRPRCRPATTRSSAERGDNGGKKEGTATSRPASGRK